LLSPTLVWFKVAS